VVCCGVSRYGTFVAAWCSVLRCVAVCVLQCVMVCCGALRRGAVCCRVLQCVAVCYSDVQHVVVTTGTCIVRIYALFKHGMTYLYV